MKVRGESAEGKNPILVSFAPESKPQQLHVSGKDGDMEIYVF